MKLDKWLTDTGTTKEALAKEVGVTVMSINRYIKGRIPNKETMLKLCRATGYQVMPNDFYNMKEF